MMDLVMAIRCKINSRRLSRYIDRYFSAPLTEYEILKVREHLAECEKCTAAVLELSSMKSTLRWLGSSQLPDESSIERIRQSLTRDFKESD
jgi:anti-sigma factor RsiW